MELSEILAAIQSLPGEEQQKLMEALSTPVPEPEPQGEVPAVEENGEGAEGALAVEAEGTEDEGAATEEGDAIPEDGTQQVDAGVDEAQPEPEVDPIPEMSKSPTVPEQEALAPAPALLDEQGGELPVDYQQIIDGLNAKSLALEAENRQLKAKMEGAFGLTSKPGGFVPVNPLYGKTDDIPPMRKR